MGIMAESINTTKPAIKAFRLNELNPAPYNPHVISDASFKGLENSISRFNCVEPIIVNIREGKNVIVGGHARHRAMSNLYGLDYEIDCVVVDLSEAEERLLNATLNNPKIQGEYDTVKLAESIEKIKAEMPNDTGLVDLRIEELLSEISNETQTLNLLESRNSLAKQFIVPPFSILDARQGYWQERKRAWLGLGIRSDIGRDTLKTTGSLSGTVPHYYEFKKQAEIKLGHEISHKEFQEKYLDEYFSNTTLAFTETGGILSVFDPVLCELAYRWFCPNDGRILDPFAGGSVRGIVAAYLGYKYVGVELRSEQVEANIKQASEIVPGNQPVFYTGDSAELDSFVNGDFDFIFSCPPYADFEVYSNNPKDLSNMSYEDFMTAYRRIIYLCVARLKVNRFACFIVGDVRDAKTGLYRNFVSDTVAAFQESGMKLYNEAILITQIGSLPIRVKQQFLKGRKLGKAHQNVLVFYKGDTNAIKQEFGNVEVGDWFNESEN